MGKVGESAHDAGSVYSDYVPDFIALERLTLPPAPWLVFIAADTSDVVDAVLARVAERFVSAGVSVVSVWGPDCERVHDMFDDVYVGDGTTTRAMPLITTWHADEELADAVEFFMLNAGSLTEAASPNRLAVTVANREWELTVATVVSRHCH